MLERTTHIHRNENALLFDLAPDGVYHAVNVTINPVRSYRTISRLPGYTGSYIFCCTFPGVAPAGRYPASCPVEPGLSSEPCVDPAITSSPRHRAL